MSAVSTPYRLRRKGDVIHVSRPHCSAFSAYPIFERTGPGRWIRGRNSFQARNACGDAPRSQSANKKRAARAAARPPWSLAASARLDAEGLMAVAAVLADGLKIGLESIEVLGIALRRLDVVGELGDRRLEVVHSFPDRRSRGCLGAGFRAIRKQRRHLLGVFGKGRVNFLSFGGVERPLALDHCGADLRLLAALFHQGLALLDELRTALRRGRSHAEQKNSESNNQFVKHGAASSSHHELTGGFHIQR